MENEINFTQKIKIFFDEVFIELKKVIWPTKKQVTTSTIVILIVVFITAIYLNLVDMGFSYLMNLLFK